MAMPRNLANKRHAVSLRLPPDLLEAIDAECEERVVGRNKLVEHCLRDGLTRLPRASLSTTPAPATSVKRPDPTVRTHTNGLGW